MSALTFPPLVKGGKKRAHSRTLLAFVGWAPPTVIGRGGFRVGGRSLRLCKVGVDGVEKSIARGAFLLRQGGCRRLTFPPLVKGGPGGVGRRASASSVYLPVRP